jgi:gliding motility-associated-like protein
MDWKKVILLVLLTFVGNAMNSVAQNVALPIGTTTNNESGSTIVRHSSGDYFIGGYHNNAALVTRVDPAGNVIWSKSLDFGADPDYIMELDITSNNFLIGCGNAKDASSWNDYGFAFKMDLNGNVVWSRVLNCANFYVWTGGIKENTNGNYRVIGSYQDNRLDNYMIEFDPLTGNVVWDSIYAIAPFSNAWDESFYDIDIHPLNNASYIVGRFQKANGNTTYRPSLTKINANGEYEWCKTYLYNSATSGGRFYSYSIDVDGDSLIFGLLGKNGAANPPFQTGLIKTDTAGNIGLAKLYSSPTGQDLRSYNMVNTPNGYVLAGWIENGNKELFLIKTDKQGNVLWSKTYGDLGVDDVRLASSNSRVIVDGTQIVTVGRTNSFGPNYDIFLVKADLATGDLTGTGCYNNLNVTTTNLPHYQEDYPMIRSTLPITFNSPPVISNNIVMDLVGNLVEDVTDTVVGGDTMVVCSGPVVIRADWSPTLTYNWNTGGTGQTETVTTSGTYWVDVSGAGGCVIWSDTVEVIMDSLTLNLGNDTTLCSATSLLLDGTTPTATSYLWQDGSTNPTFNATTSGTYWLEVSNANCVYRDSIDIQFVVGPTVDLGNDTIICGNSIPILLDATTAGATYLWQNGSTNSTFNATTSGTYWVQVDVGTCIATDSINIQYISAATVNLGNDTTMCGTSTLLLDATATSGTYLWQDGSANPTFTVTGPGTYWVELTIGTCVASDTIQVQYLPSPSVNLGNDTVLCGSASFLIDGTTSGTITYQWQDGTNTPIYNATLSGIYWLQVTENGCSAVDSIDVQFVVPPVIALSDTVLCDGQTVTLDATINGGTYLWNTTATTATISINSTGTYDVVVTDAFGCTGADTAIVTVEPIPEVDFGNDTLLCTGDTLLLNAFVHNATYTWQDASTGSFFVANNSGTYWVEVAVGGCTAHDSIDVNYESLPVLSLSDSAVCYGTTLQLDVSNPGSTYLWENGSTNPVYEINANGNYQVWITNYCGTATDSFEVIYTDCYCDLYVPNAFTPEGDGHNEVFVPVTSCDLFQYELMIFNRWGELIFETTTINDYWDGTYKGLLSQDGVYVWKITYRFDAEVAETTTKYGHVVLLR